MAKREIVKNEKEGILNGKVKEQNWKVDLRLNNLIE